MTFIGIDPGKAGGIVVLGDSGQVLAFCKMPETDRDIADIVREASCVPCHAMLEKVHAMPKQGVSSTFTFGCGYGGLRMALTAFGIAFDEVTPQRWQKAMGCLSGGDKNITKARAQALFPGVKVTHNLADALLIAEHCRRTFRDSR